MLIVMVDESNKKGKVMGDGVKEQQLFLHDRKHSSPSLQSPTGLHCLVTYSTFTVRIISNT